MQRRHSCKTDGIVLFFIGLLLVYNTCTFLQIYDNFYLKFTSSAAILVYICTRKGKIDGRYSSILGSFILTIGVTTLVLYINNNTSVWTTYFSSLWTLLYSVIMYAFIIRSFTKQVIEKFVRFQVIILLPSVLATIVILNDYPLAARAIGGIGEGITNEQELMRRGCGGYTFVYGIVAIIYAVMYRVKRGSNKPILRVLCIVVLALLSYMIIKANYTTAILTAVIMMIYVYFMPEDIRKSIPLIILLVVVTSLSIEWILQGLYDITGKLGMDFVQHKFSMLLSAFNVEGYYTSMSRYDVLSKSITGFFQSPLVGGPIAGGHSYILDILARFGLLSVFIYMFIFKSIRMILSHCCNQKAVAGLTILYIIVATIDTYDSPGQINMTFLFAPLVLGIYPNEGINIKSVNK